MPPRLRLLRAPVLLGQLPIRRSSNSTLTRLSERCPETRSVLRYSDSPKDRASTHPAGYSAAARRAKTAPETTTGAGDGLFTVPEPPGRFFGRQASVIRPALIHLGRGWPGRLGALLAAHYRHQLLVGKSL